MPVRIAAAFIACALSLCVSPALAQQARPTPYMASIASGRAMMRAGPGQTYPGVWLYVRRDLPIQVVRIHGDWRQIRDPDGTTGWMLVSLLSDQRTAIVRGQGLSPMREAPDETSPIRFRAEPNVVGRVSRCGGGWCNFDVGGRSGYIRIDRVWGVEPNETIR